MVSRRLPLLISRRRRNIPCGCAKLLAGGVADGQMAAGFVRERRWENMLDRRLTPIAIVCAAFLQTPAIAASQQPTAVIQGLRLSF